MNNVTDENQLLTRNAVLDILHKYNKGRVSLRSVLRSHRTETFYTDDLYSEIQYLAMGIVQHLNTIDFLISRSIRKGSFKDLPSQSLNLIRIAVFQAKWQGISTDWILNSATNAELLPILKEAFTKNLEDLISHLPKSQQLSLVYSHPSFIVETLLGKLSESELISLMIGNNSRGSTYMRVNKLLDPALASLRDLGNLGVQLEADSSIQGIFKVISGIDSLIQSYQFQKNEVLLQDKASVLTVHALSPAPNDFIWDACAAPGMKTQLIWELMEKKGKVIATESSSKRFHMAHERAHQLGAGEVEWLQGDASTCPISGADKILIDAPCSSTGMLRSHPSYKWRLNKNTLFSIMAVQNKILEGIVSRYSERPGTEIVYSTCSLLPHEGESQIDTIISKYPVELIDIPWLDHSGYPGFACSKHVRRLFPHSDDTDGFFIAKMMVTH